MTAFLHIIHEQTPPPPAYNTSTDFVAFTSFHIITAPKTCK